jgi:hypothetical protein
MTKHSRQPKVTVLDRRLDDSSAEPSTALPRDIPLPTRPIQPPAVDEAELDQPEEGRDPTLPENPVQGAPGHQVKEPRSEDEDEEGRSTTEQLIDAGAKKAEQDKVQQATRAPTRQNRK